MSRRRPRSVARVERASPLEQRTPPRIMSDSASSISAAPSRRRTRADPAPDRALVGSALMIVVGRHRWRQGGSSANAVAIRRRRRRRPGNLSSLMKPTISPVAPRLGLVQSHRRCCVGSDPRAGAIRVRAHDGQRAFRRRAARRSLCSIRSRSVRRSTRGVGDKASLWRHNGDDGDLIVLAVSWLSVAGYSASFFGGGHALSQRPARAGAPVTPISFASAGSSPRLDGFAIATGSAGSRCRSRCDRGDDTSRPDGASRLSYGTPTALPRTVPASASRLPVSTRRRCGIEGRQVRRRSR